MAQACQPQEDMPCDLHWPNYVRIALEMPSSQAQPSLRKHPDLLMFTANSASFGVYHKILRKGISNHAGKVQ